MNTIAFSVRVVTIVTWCGSPSVAADPMVVPTPSEIESFDGTTALPVHIEADDAFAPQAEALGLALAALMGDATHSHLAGERNSTDAIRLVVDEALGEESYVLESRDGILLQASTTTGIAHATATLLQLASRDDSGVWIVPKVKITDAPDFPFRCFMADLGRNPHSPETMRRVVDMLWLAKANYLHLHLTDDQLCSWPSERFPKLSNKRAGWTMEDWRELEQYSQARGVTIIPELEMPAHSGILRRTYPEVFGNTTTDVATLDTAFDGLTTILAEMMGVFQATPYIHIGADEAAGVDEVVQRDFINRINEFVRSKGRTTVVWEGPRPGKGANKVDTNVVHMNWRSNEYTPAEVLRDGYTLVNATWDPLYVVDHYPRTMFTAVPSRSFYNFDIRRFKHVNPGFPTYNRPRRIETSKGLIGFCMPWWEGREENLFPLCRQRLNAVSARVWNDDGEQSFEHFMQRDDKLEKLLETIHPWQGQAPTAGWSNRTAEAMPGNLAYGKKVSVSVGESQPHFGPQRLTNGVTDSFDHFLGYPTVPEAILITIDLGEVKRVGRVIIYETAQGKSWEQYELQVSVDNTNFTSIGKTDKGSRADSNSVTFAFDPVEVRYVRVQTAGCKDLTFPSFSRLCEVMVFEE